MLNGEKILNELNTFEMNAVQAVPDQKSEDEDLPYESLEDYSTDPIGFEEMSEMVSTKVKTFFSLSAKYNHRDPKYLEVCGFLERGIKYLAGCCLTAVLLKKKGHELPKLEDLTTHWLYGIVSFNIRKLNRTVDEELSGAREIPAKWLDMQFRYINLAERLKSTETKIFEYACFCGMNGEKYVEHALMFSEKAWNRHEVKKYVRKPDFRLAPAFSPIKSSEDKAESGEPEAESVIKGSECKAESPIKRSEGKEESGERKAAPCTSPLIPNLITEHDPEAIEAIFRRYAGLMDEADST